MCFDEGILQSFLDGELEEGKRREIKEHLASCTYCRNIYRELEDNDFFAAEKFNGLNQVFSKNQTDLEDSWGKIIIKTKQADSGRRGIKMKTYKWKKTLIAGVAGLAVVSSLTLRPVQGIASDLLKVFRVSKMQTVNLTLDDLQQIRDSLSAQEGKIDMASLGKAEITGNRKNTVVYEGEESWAQLKNISDFAVKLPGYLPETIKTGIAAGSSEGQITGTIDERGNFVPAEGSGRGNRFNAVVQDGFAMDFSLNVNNVNDALKSLGGTKLLPSEINEKPFTINMPKVVDLSIGGGNKYLNITQAKSPEVIVPQGVDEEQLRLALLDLPIIPENVRSQLAGINDWRNTLIVPNIEGSTEQVQVNGSEAAYVKNGQHGRLIWQENGVIYTINSNLDKEEILKIAAEMR